MAKKEKHLKLSPKGVAILVVFVVGMIVATYFFTGYMLTGSKAAGYGFVYWDKNKSQWKQTTIGEAYTKSGGGKENKEKLEKAFKEQIDRWRKER